MAGSGGGTAVPSGSAHCLNISRRSLSSIADLLAGLSEHSDQTLPPSGKTGLDCAGRQAAFRRNHVDRQVSQVMQDDHLAFAQRQSAKRRAQIGGCERLAWPYLLVVRLSGEPRHDPASASHPTTGIDREPQRDLPDPCLGLVVAAKPRPPQDAAGKRLLGNILSLMPVAEHGGHHRYEPAIVGLIELLEVAVEAHPDHLLPLRCYWSTQQYTPQCPLRFGYGVTIG